MTKGTPVLIGILLGAFVLLMKSDTPRGIRNHNPGNIRNNGIKWDGLAATQTDPEYYQFRSPVWGIRAMARILKTYRNAYGLNTVRGIVSRWAPPNENDTESYIKHVASAVGVGPDEALNADQDTQVKLIKAIIKHENGVQPYPDELITRGVSIA